MFVTFKHNQSNMPQDFPGISYKDFYLSVSNSEKLLGVTVYTTLSWNTQVDSVINKCNTYIFYIFYPVYNHYICCYFTMHTFYPILTGVVLSWATVIQHLKTG